MRIGPNERKILLKLVPGEFVPPSIYLGDYGRCPAGHTLNRLVYDKKLAIMRHQTWTPEEHLRRINDKSTPPGRATAEINAALKPTEEGLKVIRRLKNESGT